MNIKIKTMYIYKMVSSNNWHYYSIRILETGQRLFDGKLYKAETKDTNCHSNATLITTSLSKTI